MNEPMVCPPKSTARTSSTEYANPRVVRGNLCNEQKPIVCVKRVANTLHTGWRRFTVEGPGRHSKGQFWLRWSLTDASVELTSAISTAFENGSGEFVSWKMVKEAVEAAIVLH